MVFYEYFLGERIVSKIKIIIYIYGFNLINIDFFNVIIFNFNIFKLDFLLMDGILGVSIVKVVGGGWMSYWWFIKIF